AAFMDLRSHGKVALVTGSSRGIELATAKAFAAEGWRVMLSARSAEQLREMEEALRETRAEVAAHAADVGSPDRLIGREFRALAPFSHGWETRPRPPHPRVRAAAGADRDPASTWPRGREQTARASSALRDLSLVAARHARKLDAVSPHAAPMVQVSLVPAAPRPRCDLSVHRRHLHTVRGRADARRAGRTDGGGVGGRADRCRLQACILGELAAAVAGRLCGARLVCDVWAAPDTSVHGAAGSGPDSRRRCALYRRRGDSSPTDAVSHANLAWFCDCRRRLPLRRGP